MHHGIPSLRPLGFGAAIVTLGIVACSAADEQPGAMAMGTGATTPLTGGSGGIGAAGGLATGANTSTGATSSGGLGTGASSVGGGTNPDVPDLPPNWTSEGTTTWRNDARGAYTIFHDDTCNFGNQYDIADPELHARGLVASFGAISGSCDDQWQQLRTLIDHGHEVASHSVSHPNLRELAESNNLGEALGEIDSARATLETGIGNGYEVTFFIFPFDQFNDTLVDHLRAQQYLGTRAGGRGFMGANFDDDFRIEFNVYGPGYSIYSEAGGTPCAGAYSGIDWNEASSECRLYVLTRYADEIAEAGGYGIQELHSVGNEGWEPVPVEEYKTYLDHLKSKVDAGDLWVATASDAIRYRRAREACAALVAGDVMYFEPSAECTTHATTLTFRLRPMGGTTPASLSATQNGAPVTVTNAGDGSFLVNAHPLDGVVQLTPTL